MNAKKFLLTFFASVLVLFGAISFVNTLVNPLRTLPMPWSLNLPSEKNDYFVKFKLLEKARGTKALILGSSRAESFLPSRFEDLMGLKTFSAALGGAGAPAKLAFLRKANQHHKIEFIFYLSDFYELKKREIDPKLLYQEEMSLLIKPELKDISITPWTDRLLHYIDHRLLENSINFLGRFFRGATFETGFFPDGSTKRSIVPILDKNRIVLKEASDRTFNEYMANTFFDFYELSEGRKRIIQKIVNTAKVNNSTLAIILSPYHPYFENRFQKHTHLIRLKEEWRQFMLKLHDGKSVFVIDLTDTSKLFPPSKTYWADGVHFYKEASEKIIKEVKKVLGAKVPTKH